MLSTPYTRAPRANTHHQCDACEGAIAKGSIYKKLTFFSKDAPGIMRLCYGCFDLYNLFHFDSVSCYKTVEEYAEAIGASYKSMHKVESDEARADALRDEAFDNEWEDKQIREGDKL